MVLDYQWIIIKNSANKAFRVASASQENKFYRMNKLLGFRKSVESSVTKNENLTGHDALPTARNSSEVARL